MSWNFALILFVLLVLTGIIWDSIWPYCGAAASVGPKRRWRSTTRP